MHYYNLYYSTVRITKNGSQININFSNTLVVNYSISIIVSNSPFDSELSDYIIDALPVSAKSMLAQQNPWCWLFFSDAVYL